MNERIKELIEQAFIVTTDGKIGHVSTSMIENFAELIIAECSKVITDMPNKMVGQKLNKYNTGWRNGRLLAKENIEYHFGIEGPKTL